MFIAAGSNPMLTNVVFIDNRVSGDGGGGAIKTYNSSPILTNVTFSGNHAVVGGAIDNWHSSMILTNATLRGNSADQYGAAIYNQESNPTITNTIIWANYPAESQLLDARGESIVTYSIIAGGRPGPGNQEADPQLGSLADNDGGLPAFPLPPGSPAIDGGSPSGCPATDQLGLPRPVDGDGNGVVACDIGAVEYQGPK